MKVEKVYLTESPSTETSKWLFNQLTGIKSGNGNGLKLSSDDVNAIVKQFKQDYSKENNQTLMRQKAQEIVDAKKAELNKPDEDKQTQLTHLDKLYDELYEYTKPNSKVKVKTDMRILSENLKAHLNDLGGDKIVPDKIIEYLKKYPLTFVQSFISHLGKEDMGNKNNPVLNAFSTDQAGEILTGNTTVFERFYNLLINRYFNFDSQYLSNPNAAIYVLELYTKVRDEGLREKAITADITDKAKNPYSLKINNLITSGRLAEITNGSNKSRSEKMADAQDTYNQLDAKDKAEFKKWIANNGNQNNG